jgi:hypothetical protein
MAKIERVWVDLGELWEKRCVAGPIWGHKFAVGWVERTLVKKSLLARKVGMV